MNIDPDQQLAGFPILEIRRLLRKGSHSNMWDSGLGEEVLNATSPRAEEVLKTLEKEGYIERMAVPDGKQYWTNTVKGNALAQASAAKPLRRGTADKRLSEFLERVKYVRESNEFLHKVKKVVVFGSYLSPKERLSDIDLAIDLAPKVQDREEQQRLQQEYIRAAKRDGKLFDTLVEELFWPQRKVWLFLKGRSRSVSLHSMDDLMLQNVQYKTVYEDAE